MQKKSFRRLLYPAFTWKSLIRIAVTALAAYLFFSRVCNPLYIQGYSMEPTYKNGSFNFCWQPAYWYFEPGRYDVVIVRLAGRKIMLMKRVVALAGETVEFRNGNLVVNGVLVKEPYIEYPCN